MENIIKCKICGYECSNKAFSSHLKRKHGLTQEQYFLKYIGEKGTCAHCGNETDFLSIQKGYKKYCSRSCLQKSKEVKEKRINTTRKKYGVDSTNKLDWVKEKKINSLKKNYGEDVNNSYQLSHIKKKREDTFKNDMDKIQEKRENTNKKKYGVLYTSQVPSTRIKSKDTMYKKWGVDHYCKSEEYKKKKRIEFYYTILNNPKIRNVVEPLFLEKDILDSFSGYLWKCKQCNNTFWDSLENGKIPRCSICYPKNGGQSKGEQEVYHFLSKYVTVFSKDKKFIYPKEIDILIPGNNLGIEYNGLYYHSENSGGKDKKYHLNKTKMMNKKNHFLIHIFEDEWMFKTNIVKSILLSKLGYAYYKIPARKCNISKVSNNEAKNFLDENHLQGSINGNHYGLYYNEDLIYLITVGKGRWDEKTEILRSCPKLFHNVQGGFSKLVKNIFKKYGSLISYVDKRYGDGHSLEISGWNKLKETGPGYYYIKGHSRFNRINFQKHKLENKLEFFDSELTEWENMQLNGYDRVWDCGNLVYVYE